MGFPTNGRARKLVGANANEARQQAASASCRGRRPSLVHLERGKNSLAPIRSDPDSLVSTRINTAFIERHNGTDRNRNGRKVRKTYCFSKDWDVHEAATYFTMYSYNFRWPVRTLRVRGGDGRWHPRTPAMAAGLTDHVWSLEEWLRFPAVQSN